VGRVLTFADPEIIKLASEKFVPVALDDWYQRRRKDAEGAFFRKVSDQGPRKSSGENGTRQGIYVFTASGKLLAFRNHQDPDVMRTVFRQALTAWNKLPSSEKDPGAVKIPDPAKVDSGFERKLPKDAVILNVFTRILDKDAKGDYSHGTCEFTGGDRAAHDRLWLTADEWKGLIPKNPKVGDQVSVPERVAMRIARFHLIDNTRGEPPHWEINQVRKAKLAVEVTRVTEQKIELKIVGDFLLATSADAKKVDRGFDLNLLGTIIVDRAKQRIERFDMVGLGDHWGAGPYTRQARPGRMPLGVAFELSPGDTPSDQVPPQGARSLQLYLRAER